MFFTDKTRKHAIIPNTETEIKWRCYQYCFTLLTIRFQPLSQVSKIGQYAFARASSLMEIELPPTITHIGSNAFHNCTSLTAINIPPLVRSIGPGAFLHCTSLLIVKCEPFHASSSLSPSSSEQFTSSSLSPSALVGIEDSAFCQCSSLISISLPLKTLSYIGPRGFYGCSSLLSIGLPPPPMMNDGNIQNIPLIESKAFTGCHELQRVVNTGNEEYTIMNNQSSSDIIDWLMLRFVNLPLHQVCYSSNVSRISLQNALENEKKRDKPATDTIEDRMGMTPLHILICNPFATMELVQMLLEEYPEMSTKETIQGLTAIDLYLMCNNLQSFNEIIRQKQKPINNARVEDKQDTRLSLCKAIEQGLSWKNIQFLSTLDPIMQEEQCRIDEKTGLFPFLKATTSERCSLEVMFHLAMNNLHDVFVIKTS